MIRHYYSLDDDALFGTTEEDPECGEDYCETCSACLHCFGADPCLGYFNDRPSGVHLWACYVKSPPPNLTIIPQLPS